jgi:hypothetical protein
MEIRALLSCVAVRVPRWYHFKPHGETFIVEYLEGAFDLLGCSPEVRLEHNLVRAKAGVVTGEGERREQEKNNFCFVIHGTFSNIHGRMKAIRH